MPGVGMEKVEYRTSYLILHVIYKTFSPWESFLAALPQEPYCHG